MTETDTPTYEIKADDVTMWKSDRHPTQDAIDLVAIKANERGWNGVSLDLFRNGAWKQSLTVTPEVMEAIDDQAHAEEIMESFQRGGR